MDRRTLGSIGLLLAGAGLYALVDALRPRGPAPDPAPAAPHATNADAPAPAPIAPRAPEVPTPAPVPPKPTTPRPPAPLPSTSLAGGPPPPVAPQPVVPPPVVAPPLPTPPLPKPPSEEPPLAAPSPANRRALELALEMRLETLRIYRLMHAAGRVTEDAVDDAELAVIDARHDVAELTGPAWHRARAEILARIAESAASEVVVGHVPQDVADLAKLDLARERALAGDPSDYATTRDDVLARSAQRRRALVDAGRLSRHEALAADLASERRFPPLPADPAPPR